MVVVLPAPFGPRKPKQTPWRTSKSTASTARRSPYLLTRPSATTAGEPRCGRTVSTGPRPGCDPPDHDPPAPSPGLRCDHDGTVSFDQLFRRLEARNDAELAAAEAEAAAAGKEPFDLARLEQLLGEDPGSMAGRERRLRMSYYIAHPELRTLAASPSSASKWTCGTDPGCATAT